MSDGSSASVDATGRQSTFADEDRTWQTALTEGQADEALSRYQMQDLKDEATLDELRAAADLRSHLRAKSYEQAAQVLQDSDQTAPLVNWHEVRGQVNTLKESQAALDKLELDEAMRLLHNVDQPLLYAEAETQRGTARVYRDERQAAELHFNQALISDPKHYRALTNRGNLALEDGRVDEAIADYERAIELNENFSNAHHNLGVAYRKKGDISRSVASIRKAQRMLHTNDAKSMRGRFASSTGSGPRLGRWLFYGAIAVVIYLALRGQGII